MERGCRVCQNHNQGVEMITFKSIASSSEGNAYLLSDGSSTLLLEAGIPIARIKQAVNFRLSEQVDACIISHAHFDHSKAIPALLQAGIPCHMSIGTAQKLGCLLHRKCHTIKAERQVDIGGWIVLPFAGVHDPDEECLGFLLQSRYTGEKVLFATDTAYIPNRFRGLNLIAVECNWDQETMTENIEKHALTWSQYRRIMATHMGLNTLCEFLKANDLNGVKTIYLLHLSDGNCSEQLMIKTVQALTGIPTVACSK